jgi:ABC-2 type transport system permease protein
MNNILRSEAFKLFRNTNILMVLLATVITSGLSSYLIVIDWWHITNQAYETLGLGDFKGMSMFTVPLILGMFLSFIASTLITYEFKSHGVIKNQLMSGQKRSNLIIGKMIVFALVSVVITFIVPLLITSLMANLFGSIQVNDQTFEVIVRAYSLVVLNLIAYSTTLFFIALISKDSGRTITFSLVFTLIMFVAEKLVGTSKLLNFIYEQTIFFNFTQIAKLNLSTGELLHNLTIGLATILTMCVINCITFKKMEIH